MRAIAAASVLMHVLAALRERLSLIGGTAEVQSVPGAGTVTVLTAPLAMDEWPPGERGE